MRLACVFIPSLRAQDGGGVNDDWRIRGVGEVRVAMTAHPTGICGEWVGNAVGRIGAREWGMRAVRFRRSGALMIQTEKEVPQPQELEALGFWITKRAPISSSE